MSSNSNRGAPSEGTKVTPGQNAPINPEGAGTVAQDSLAAESYRKGGDFASNVGAKPEKFSLEERANAMQSGGGSGSLPPQGQTAPSYVENQYIKDTAGPHGKNITEEKLDDPELRDGLQRALKSEPGSMNDPSRLAEAKMQKQDASSAAFQGPRDGVAGSTTVYDNLDRQEEA